MLVSWAIWVTFLNPRPNSTVVHAKSLQSCPTICNLRTVARQTPLSMGILQERILEWMDCHAFLQGFFQTQVLNLHLVCILHWQAGSLPLVPPGKPNSTVMEFKKLSMAPYYLVLESQVHIPQVAMQDCPRSDHSLTSKPYTHISTNAQAA